MFYYTDRSLKKTCKIQQKHEGTSQILTKKNIFNIFRVINKYVSLQCVLIRKSDVSKIDISF